ncbi:hypothetical protein D8674_008385 [Pyrus ussuriensis x Pyrus communis]|uniref:Uncharacterized protein n=1 Tax=Pyrus ussuriensis x Pyrus communis TaxID=2448454 RepID=A0A5N5HSM2_9ROSA|nr:hypothetical protein D8674_008385 [Pyrus ussuriensis x Pyrus communis]
MSQLIRSSKVMTTAPHSIPPPPTSAPASSASSVVLSVSAMCGHRRPRTPDTTSASTSDASRSQQAKKNTWEPCRQLKMAKVTLVTNGRITIEYDDRHQAAPMPKQNSTLARDIGHVTNYNFDNINDNMLAYINSFFTFGDPQVVLEEGCLKDFEDREENWVWLCSHFQEPGYKKAKANKINREKKTLLYHSSLRPFSYRMKAWQQALSQSGICLPDIHPPSMFEPLQPEHAQNSTHLTSEPVLNPKPFLPQSF